MGIAGCGASAPSTGAGGGTATRFDGMSAAGMTAPNFALHDQHGQLIRLSAQRGKFVVITFLYVHCKNVCPIIAGQLNQVLRSLGPARADVRVLAVSVDPTGDTHAAVAHFIASHHLLPQFLYLTGTAATLEPVWKDYHVASVQTGKGVVVGHTAVEFLLDRSGRPQVIYDTSDTPEEIIHDLRLLGLQD